MSPQRWRQVEELFHAASELPATERSALLAETGDPELIREVEVLLEAELSSSNIFEEAEEDRNRAAAEITSEAPVKRVGPYQLVSLIGKGGMGAVYLGERTEGFEQKVAVKLVRADRESPAILARFRAERQILASLQHPNIARLLDGGIAEFGQPCLVMEYVDGIPMTDYCAARGMDVRARLRLFREVCSAVECAHRALVVHRDIKPGNILVTADGVPKLLDFGIARILTPGETSPTLTRTTERMMTPEYAAPEQILHQPVTTATDVWALGVLLYELLTGIRPFRQTSSPFELEQRICQVEPPRPSAMLPGPPGRHLKGDLDAIVLKALRKDPTARYASVDRLSVDVENYLNGLPVSAQKGTTRYRASKFARRHWLPLFFAAALAISLLAFSAAMGVLQKRFRQERDVAQEAGARATAVAGFLEGLFRAADPNQTRGRSLSARDLLDEGSRKIQHELTQEPAVAAELYDAIAESYKNLGALDQSTAALEKELAIQRQAPPGPLHDGIEATLRQLGDHERLHSHFDRAEEYLRAALQWADRVGPKDPERPHILNNLGLLMEQEGRLAEAEKLMREAVALETSVKDGWFDLLIMQANLGNVLISYGKYPEGLALLEMTRRERRNRLGPDHPHVARSLQRLGNALADTGHYAEARRMLEEAMVEIRRVEGEYHYDVMLTAVSLAGLLEQTGDWAEAESLYRKELDAARENVGEPLAVTGLMSGLGSLLTREGKYPEAESLLGKALGMDLQMAGPQSTLAARDWCGVGVLKMQMGALGEADEFLNKCLTVRRARLMPDHVLVGSAMASLGELRFRQGRIKEAEELYRESIASLRTTFPEGHPQLASRLLGLAQVYIGSGRRAEAEPLAREGINIRRRFLPPGSPLIVEAEGILQRAN